MTKTDVDDVGRRIRGALRRVNAPALGTRGLVGLFALTACGTSAESSGGAPALICPSCVTTDVAGSETSDFSGSETTCTGDPAPVPAEGDAVALLREARDAYAGPFEARLRWGYIGDEAGSPSAFWSGEPSGYEPVTTLTGNVVLGESRYFRGRRSPIIASGPEPTEPCPDWFEVPITVELATEEGAFDVSADGTFVLGHDAQRLFATADLAGAQGSLDLHLDPRFQYTAELSFSMDIYREGKRGNLWLSVKRIEGSPPVAPELVSSYSPLTAIFPEDGCGTGFRSSPDAPLLAFEGQTATQLLASWNDWLESAQPLAAVRYDCDFDAEPLETRAAVGVPVDVSFTIGTPDLVCQSAPSPISGSPGYFGFVGPVRITTSDGLIDGQFDWGSVRPDSPDRLSLGSLFDKIPTEEFAARTGILGVDPGNSRWISSFGTADFNRGTGGGTGGFLSVEGTDCENPLGCIVTRHTRLVWGDASASDPCGP